MSISHIKPWSMMRLVRWPTPRTAEISAYAAIARAPVANGVGAKLKRLARRLTGALAAQRQREVDREIARLLARSGGRITDSMEREMMREGSGV